MKETVLILLFSLVASIESMESKPLTVEELLQLIEKKDRAGLEQRCDQEQVKLKAKCGEDLYNAMHKVCVQDRDMLANLLTLAASCNQEILYENEELKLLIKPEAMLVVTMPRKLEFNAAEFIALAKPH